MSDSLPVQRCCESHGDWTELTEHLIAAYADVPAERITELVVGTRRAEEVFGLPEAERLATAELIVRYQLMQLTGEIAATVRLDPETHARRAPEAAEGCPADG